MTSDAARSLFRSSWSLSFFAAHQAGSVLASLAALRPALSETEAFEAVVRAVERESGVTMRDLLQNGWRFQRMAADTVFGVAEPAFGTLRSLASASLLRGSLRVGRRTSEIFDAASPQRLSLLWRELANKLAAFEEFQYAHHVLDLMRGDGTKLATAVARADQLGPDRRLWVLEGLGYSCAEAAWRGDHPPSGLLAGSRLDDVPDACWLPLHTGLGLSLARRLLFKEGSRSRHLIELCDDNARDGYQGAVYEALGLMLRHLDPAALAGIDRQLMADNPERSALLWHGAGRGLYFLPSQSRPGSLSQAVDLARRDAPHALARGNALAGLGWAFTLVNFLHPKILGSFIEHHLRGWSEADEQAFSHGISSAFTFWFDAAGGKPDRPLRVFRDYRPAASNDESSRRWQRLVTRPCELALARYPAMKDETRLGEIFRHMGEV